MAVNRLGFAAAVDKWTRETEQRMTAVFRESASEVIEEMQKPVGAGGNMPVDTGFLRASLQVGINSAPASPNRVNPRVGAHTAPNVDLVIQGAEIGDTVVASYGANYAGHVNYGANGRAPRQFVGLAAQKWQSIVSSVVARLRGRAAP